MVLLSCTKIRAEFNSGLDRSSKFADWDRKCEKRIKLLATLSSEAAETTRSQRPPIARHFQEKILSNTGNKRLRPHGSGWLDATLDPMEISGGLRGYGIRLTQFVREGNAPLSPKYKVIQGFDSVPSMLHIGRKVEDITGGGKGERRVEYLDGVEYSRAELLSTSLPHVQPFINGPVR
eukprot:763897-Hanusia_phi.AAC.2